MTKMYGCDSDETGSVGKEISRRNEGTSEERKARARKGRHERGKEGTSEKRKA